MQQDEIVFVIDNPFPYYGGGREVWLSAMAKRLAQKYAISIIAPGPQGKMDVKTSVDDSNIRIFHTPPFQKALKVVPHYGDLISYILFSKYSAIYIFLKFRKRKGTTFFISLNPGLCYFTVLFMRKKNHRRICSIHGRWEMEMTRLYPPFKKLFELLGKVSYRDCNLIMPNGYYDNEYMKDIAKLNNFDEKTMILPAAVELRPFLDANPDVQNPNKKEKTITMCGTLSVLKGVPELIASIPYIIKNYKGEFKVVFIGKGDKKQFADMGKMLGVERYIEFAGEKPRLDLVRSLQESDIVACNFGGGGLPASLLEAMAVGKPIVAWDNKMYNIVTTHKKTAYLVNHNDPEALGTGIAYLLNNPDFARQLGINAKKEAAKYDVDEMIKNFLSILEHVKAMET